MPQTTLCRYTRVGRRWARECKIYVSVYRADKQGQKQTRAKRRFIEKHRVDKGRFLEQNQIAAPAQFEPCQYGTSLSHTYRLRRGTYVPLVVVTYRRWYMHKKKASVPHSAYGFYLDIYFSTTAVHDPRATPATVLPYYCVVYGVGTVSALGPFVGCLQFSLKAIIHSN